MFVLGGGFAFGLVWRSTSKAEMIKVVKSTEKEWRKGKEKTCRREWREKKRPDTRRKMRLVCVLITFENNTGPSYGRTDGPTDGHDLIWRCDGASKN